MQDEKELGKDKQQTQVFPEFQSNPGIFYSGLSYLAPLQEAHSNRGTRRS